MRFDSFSHMLAHFARTAPGAPALRYGEKALTYGQLHEAVLAGAERYRKEGRTCLAVLTDGSLDCVLAILAANLAGMQVVLLDDRMPDELLCSLIPYTDADAVWGDPDLAGLLAPHLTDGVTDGAGRILFFTSGTTERSKAVVLTDASLCASAWNGSALLPLSPDDTLLCLLPLCHVFGFVCGLLWGLSCGACVALGRGARHYGDDCAYYRPTAVSVVPMLLGFLLKANALTDSVRLILIGAGDCPKPLLDAASMRGARVCFGYGLTETSSGVALSTEGDPYSMTVCPDDTITLADDGEILIHAPTCMMQGYYKRLDATEAVLKDGVLHTGDLGRFDADGGLRVIGRKKEILVLPDGTKLFLPEYEAALSAVLGTQELAVTLSDGRPVLIIPGAWDRRELERKLMPVMAELPRGQQLADILITDEPLPRTAAGKIQRWSLQQKAGNA